MAAAWAATIEQPRSFQGIGDVGAAVRQQGFMDGAIVLALYEGQAAFVLDNAADLSLGAYSCRWSATQPSSRMRE